MDKIVQNNLLIVTNLLKWKCEKYITVSGVKTNDFCIQVPIEIRTDERYNYTLKEPLYFAKNLRFHIDLTWQKLVLNKISEMLYNDTKYEYSLIETLQVLENWLNHENENKIKIQSERDIFNAIIAFIKKRKN